MKNGFSKSLLLSAALVGVLALTSARATDITPTEARGIAKEAYVYGFPAVDSYRVEFKRVAEYRKQHGGE
jgi:hypothetical protein